MSDWLSEFRQVRRRIAKLRDVGIEPVEVVLSPETWPRLQHAYSEFTPGLLPKALVVRDVLGLRGRLAAGASGCIIRCFGGIHFPPDPAVTDSFIDLPRLLFGRAPRRPRERGALTAHLANSRVKRACSQELSRRGSVAASVGPPRRAAFDAAPSRVEPRGGSPGSALAETL